jgi:hypothetical protein
MVGQPRGAEGGGPAASTVSPRNIPWRPREQPIVPGGGNTGPPPPISLQEQGRFLVFLEDIGEVGNPQQPPRRERVSPRSRAPSERSKMRYVRVQLPPPPPLTRPLSRPRSWRRRRGSALDLRRFAPRSSGTTPAMVRRSTLRRYACSEGVLSVLPAPAAVPPPPATEPSSRRSCRSAPNLLRYCPTGSP